MFNAYCIDGDNLHEMSKSVFRGKHWENIIVSHLLHLPRKCLTLSILEAIFTEHFHFIYFLFLFLFFFRIKALKFHTNGLHRMSNPDF